MRTPACAVLVAVMAVGVLAAPSPPSLYPGKDVDSGLGRVEDLAFSSDGRLLAAAGAKGYGVWDAQTGNSIRRDMPGPVRRVAFGAQGTLLALGFGDGSVKVVDLRSGMLRDAAKHAKPITALAFASDGRTGASGDAEGNITLWDPDRGAIAPLKDGGIKQEILVLAFVRNTVISASKDMQVVTWDVSSKRPLRRGTMQATVRGRVAVPNSGSTDPAGEKLLLGAQLVSEQRTSSFGRGAAAPSDLRRDNLLMTSEITTGLAGVTVETGDYQAEHVTIGPGSCYAFFTSFFRNQARLHVWGLVDQGDDFVRLDLPARGSAVAVEPGGHLLAAATDTGLLKTWTISGATPADCDQYAKQTPVDNGPTITVGSETQPLIKAAPGTRVAVLRFDATGVDPGLGDAVAEMVAGELANSPQVTVIERAAIDRVLKEMEVQRSGLTAADAAKIGKGLNAKTVLFGSVRRFGDSTFVITTRAVNVETQQIEGSREVTCEKCKEQNLPRAVAALRRLIVP